MDGYPGNDSLTTTDAVVSIRVLDANDERPTFNKREYYVSIPEDISINSPLPDLDMTITDLDAVSA